MSWIVLQLLHFLQQLIRRVILRHIRNIYAPKELNKSPVCAKNAHTATDITSGKYLSLLSLPSAAKTACEVSGHVVRDHFVDVNKMVELGSGSQRSIEDVMIQAHRPISSGNC